MYLGEEMTKRLTKRYIIKNIKDIDINLTQPIRYERYYINDYLRVQKKENTFEKELLDENNRVIEKINIKEEEFNTLKKMAYKKIVRESYGYKNDSRISIKKYLEVYEGLYRVEVKFASEEELESFQKEKWMGEEITSSPLAFDKDLSKLTIEEFQKELLKYTK